MLNYFFLNKLWPDFNSNDLKKSLINLEKVKETLEQYNVNKFQK